MAELIPLFAIFFTIGVPVTALAAHFVLRPLVKDIVEALRTGPSTEVVALQHRIDELQEELTRHEVQLQQLNDAETFHRRLEGGDALSQP